MEAAVQALQANHHMRCTVDGLASIVEETGIEPSDTAALVEELKYRDMKEWGVEWLAREVANLGGAAVLKGEHVLQISGMRDVTLPKLQTDDDGVEHDEWAATKESGRFNRAGRLLKLRLSDGHSTVTAVELTTNPHIKALPLPGSKVLISNVPYRSGYMIIKPESVRLIGGGVDEMEQEYNLKQHLNAHIARAKAKAGGVPGIDTAPPFVPFGSSIGGELVPDKPEGFKVEEDEEEKKKREVDVSAADYRRRMGPAKQAPAKAAAADDGGDAGGGKGKGKGGKGGKDGGGKGGKDKLGPKVCHDFELGKCTKGTTCRFLHPEHEKRWPGKKTKEREEKEAAAVENPGKQKPDFLAEPVVALSNAAPPPVEKKEARQVDEPALPANFTMLKKDEEEKDMFGKVIKKKKEEKPKEEAKKAPLPASSSLTAALTSFHVTGAEEAAEKQFPAVGGASQSYGANDRYISDHNRDTTGYRDGGFFAKPSGGKGGRSGGGGGGGGGGKGHSSGGKGGGGGKGHSSSGGGKGHSGGGGGKGHSSGGKGGGGGSKGPSGGGSGGGGGGGGGGKGQSSSGGGKGGKGGKGGSAPAPAPAPGHVPHNKGSGGGRGKGAGNTSGGGAPQSKGGGRGSGGRGSGRG